MKSPIIFRKTFSHGRFLVALASLFSVHSLFAQNNTFTETVNGVSFTMVRVQGGTFTMGCTAEQGEDCVSDESPSHRVELSDYSIGEAEVTQALWRAVMGNNPSDFKDCDECPVEMVSWEDAQDFIKKLNTLTGKTYRLPTEAEWEYAARGGNKSRGYKYSGSNEIGEVAWCDDPDFKLHAAKGKKANELGLYDMSGNVLEWCSDWYGDYTSGRQTNPKGPVAGSDRVYRGGCFLDASLNCRVSSRIGNAPDFRTFTVGLRLATQ